MMLLSKLNESHVSKGIVEINTMTFNEDELRVIEILNHFTSRWNAED